MSCNGSGPMVDVCLSYPASGGFVCVDRDQNTYEIKYGDSLKMVAFSAADAEKLISSCGLKGTKAAAIKRYYARVEKIADSFSDFTPISE